MEETIALKIFLAVKKIIIMIS
jgi:hypothetical protein